LSIKISPVTFTYSHIPLFPSALSNKAPSIGPFCNAPAHHTSLSGATMAGAPSGQKFVEIYRLKIFPLNRD
jgi:hypothetical protein